MTEYCKYTREFPVDEWNRPGGFYSMSDVPIKRYAVLTRTARILAREGTMVEVEDCERGWRFSLDSTYIEPCEDPFVTPGTDAQT